MWPSGRTPIVLLCAGLWTWVAGPALAQEPGPPTRTSLIEQAQAEKARQLNPTRRRAAEKYLDYAENYSS